MLAEIVHRHLHHLKEAAATPVLIDGVVVPTGLITASTGSDVLCWACAFISNGADAEAGR